MDERIWTLIQMAKSGVTIQKVGPLTIIHDPSAEHSQIFAIDLQGEYVCMVGGVVDAQGNIFDRYYKGG